jgi:hypothetical protein
MMSGESKVTEANEFFAPATAAGPVRVIDLIDMTQRIAVSATNHLDK